MVIRNRNSGEIGNMVRIIEASKICPSSDSLPSTFSLPLSDYDWIFLKFPPIENLFFYHLPNDSQSLFESIVIPNLKLSLSLTLRHFFPLAGVLVWPDDSPLPFILYSRNDAVCFTLAESLDDFHTLSSPHPLEIRRFRSLLPSFHSHSNSAIPMCAIQVTRFPNHGFSIGISIHHIIADGQSLNLFFKSWAHICNKLNHLEPSPNLPNELIPSFDRSVENMFSIPLEVVTNIDRDLSYNLSFVVPSDWQRATFDLTRKHIQVLKKRALEYCTTTKKIKQEELHLSTFVVGYAHALVCLAKAKGDECKEKLYVSFVANARSISNPRKPTNYFGNCVARLNAVVEARELREEENGFSMVAKRIGDLILKLKRKGEIEGEKPLNEVLKNGGGFEVCSIASSPKYKFYEKDFGWGNPKQVEMVSLVTNNFLLIDSRDGDGGVQLALNLPTHHMDAFVSLFFEGLD